MSAVALRANGARTKRTERRMVALSAAIHVACLFLLLRGGPAPQTEFLTEVSLLEPGIPAAESAPAAAAPAAAAAVTERGALQPHREEVRFRRAAKTGDQVPDPQSDTAFEDRLNERLATLQRTTVAPSIAGLAKIEPRHPTLAGVTSVGATGSGGASPIALARGGATGGGSSPLALARGPRAASAPRLAVASLPAEASTAPRPSRAARAPQASLSGVALAGPIADRPVLEVTRPVYPEWAKAEAVEGSVTLYFLVSPDGQVQENVLVQKTAGFGDFDDNAVLALRAWVFAPLPPGRQVDQWGTITFHFRLADAR